MKKQKQALVYIINSWKPYIREKQNMILQNQHNVTEFDHNGTNQKDEQKLFNKIVILNQITKNKTEEEWKQMLNDELFEQINDDIVIDSMENQLINLSINSFDSSSKDPIVLH